METEKEKEFHVDDLDDVDDETDFWFEWVGYSVNRVLESDY